MKNLNKTGLCFAMLVAFGCFPFQNVRAENPPLAPPPPPNWSVNAANFQFNMSITARIFRGGAYDNSTDNLVGVFVGGELRGFAAPVLSAGGNAYFFITAYSNTYVGETLTFQLYIAENDDLVMASESIVFQHNAAAGNFAGPLVLQPDCDGDGDGFCAPSDCDDTDSGRYPGTTETPGDGTDQNCDGAETCFADADNDGYRPNSTATVASTDSDCADFGEALATDPTTDCDDANATAHPGGGPEICSNGINEDCLAGDGISDFVLLPKAFCNIGCDIPAVTGGRAPYQYSSDGGATYTTDNYFFLASGVTYTIQVRDAEGCTASQPFAAQANFTFSHGSTNALCNGQSTGSANFAHTGEGFPPVHYIWKKGAAVLATGTMTEGVPLDFDNLPAGNYKFFMEDASGCKQNRGLAISQPAPLAGSISKVNVLCKGGATGAATATASGGTGAKTYLWSPGGQTTTSISGLLAGTYSVAVQDQNLCEKMLTTTITEPATGLSLNVAKTDPKCFGQLNGTATATATGGAAGAKTFVWTPGGAVSAAISNLGPGMYNVTATDANGCTKTGSATLENPPLLEIANITSSPSDTKHNALVSATGGTAPLKYRRTTTSPSTWGALGTSNNFLNVTAGTYHFAVVDAKMCSDTVFEQIIPVPAPRPQGSLDRQAIRMVQLPENQLFELMPNPASDFVNLIFGENLPAAGFVELLDLHGKLLRRQPLETLLADANRLSIHDLAAGVYLVKLRAEDGTRAAKSLVISSN